MATSLTLPGQSVSAPQGTDTAGAYSTPARAPAAPVADTPTDRVNGVSQKPGVPNADGSAYGSTAAPVLRYTGGGTSGPTSTPPQDDAALRASELAGVQGKIDLINSNFADNIAAVKVANANLIGGTRARDARSGLLGSDFGAANEAGAAAKADANTTRVQNQQKAQLNTVYDSIQKDINTKQQAYQTQQNKLTEAQTKYFQTTSTDTVKNLAKNGGTLDSLSQEEYNHLIDTTGLNDAELHALYTANVPPDKIVHSSVQNGNYIQVSRNPTTGALETNVIPITGVPDSYTYDAAIQAFIPKGGIDPAKPVADQIIPYAKATSAKTPSANTKAADQKQISTDLDGAKAAIAAGADPAAVRQRFIKTHQSSISLYDNFISGKKSTSSSGTVSNPFK